MVINGALVYSSKQNMLSGRVIVLLFWNIIMVMNTIIFKSLWLMFIFNT